MNNIKPEMPLELAAIAEKFRAFPEAEPLAVTVFVLDALQRSYTLRLETLTYHDYMTRVEAGEQHTEDVLEPEPVFIVASAAINRESVNRILNNEIVCDYLVEQVTDTNPQS